MQSVAAKIARVLGYRGGKKILHLHHALPFFYRNGAIDCRDRVSRKTHMQKNNSL
jgi:hypothetical protein